ncbi:laminin subunit alpha-3 [Lates calcarifer]|nr:laminin subunit alpha-3 [Lates calcarifer]
MTKVDIVTKAEEHAEQLKRAATEFQQELHNATNSTGLLSVQGIGAYNCLINAIEKAEMAANQSREDADQAIKDVKKGGLVNKAEGLRDNSTQLQTEASNTQSDLKMLSHTVKTHKDRVKKQKEKRGALRTGISTIRDDLKTIKRDEEVLIDSAKTAASASSSTVRNITERLKNIRQEVKGIILPIVNENMDMMIKVEEALRNLNSALPVMTDNLTQVEALSRQTLPSANMTESIERIKELIEETRNFVNRLSTATTFNGKGHIELRPPRNLEDIKAFTAVDLLLNLHQNNTFKTDHRRKRRQDKDKNAHFFIFYLGNKDASGDYIGMAIRRNVLICVYKLGGVVHEVVTSHITTTTKVTSSDFDRVVFHRVYQDAQVNITQSFTSQTPGNLFLYHNLSNTMTGVLDLDPDSVVVYVGGYPENFTPPVELRYPRYRGAMKLSFINDSPVCLFNYKHAVNMDAKQPYIKIPQSDACNYYDGTGYLMAFVREPDKKQKRQFRFYTTTREADALLFYMGNEESLFYVFLERGFLVLQDQQAGQELRVQSSEKMSLNDTLFIVRTGRPKY